MPLKLLSSGGGSVLLTANTTASDFTVNVPAVNGNMVTTSDTGSITQAMLGAGVYAGYGPAFSVYRSSSNQSVTTSTWTKIQFQTKEFDTANCFDATTNYRFTPNVAGYYQFMLSAVCLVSSTVSGVGLYKNGTPFKYVNVMYASTAAYNVTNGSCICYLNGSTDYTEGWFYSNGTSPAVYPDSTQSYFQGYLVRAA